MPRKRRKGYYVDGTFVRAGSSLDEELRAERAAEPPSRTARKRASRDIRDVGAELVDLPAEVIAGLALPDTLRDAVFDAQRISSFGAKRRQVQLVGKLLRQLDSAALAAVRAAVSAERA